MKTIQYILLVFLTLFVYFHSLSFPLLTGWDDHIYVSGNIEKLVLSPENFLHWFHHPCEGMYLPLTMFSYMLDYNVWGLNGFGYHLQNIIWHLLAVIAVFKSIKFFRVNSWIAFLFVLIFSIHPQRAESVVWISERKDVLCTAFYFWSIYFYISEKKQGSLTVLSLILFIAAILSKSMAISLPFILFFFELNREKHFKLRFYLKKLWLFFLVSAIFIPVTIWAQIIPDVKISLQRQFFVIFHNFIWYIQNTLIPCELSPIYPKITLNTEILLKLSISYILIFALTFFIFKRKRNLFLFVILPLAGTFIMSIAPVIGFFSLGAIDYADRYSYIPSAFLWFSECLFLNYMFNDDTKKTQYLFRLNRVSVMMILFLFSASLAFFNILHSNSWRSYRAVLESACLHNPPAYMALCALGDLELVEGNYENAIKVSDKIKEKPKEWISEKAYLTAMLKADCIKAAALYSLNRKKEAAGILEKIKPYLNKESFFTPSEYKKMLEMLDDCRKFSAESRR